MELDKKEETKIVNQPIVLFEEYENPQTINKSIPIIFEEYERRDHINDSVVILKSESENKEGQSIFGEDAIDSKTYSKWTQEFEPILQFKLKKKIDKIIKIEQNSKGFGELGSHVWNAAFVLSRYLENVIGNWINKRCIELGAGTGLTSIVAAALGANIVATDKRSLIRLIEHNSKNNLSVDELKRFLAHELLWDTGNPFGEKFDLILGADLTYDFEDLPALVNTFLALCADNGVILIAYGKERAAIPTFFDLCTPYFNIQEIPNTELDASDITYPTFEIGIVKLTKKEKLASTD